MSNAVEILRKMKQKALHENLSKWLCETRINIGMSTCEIAAGSKSVYTAIQDEIKKRKIKNVHAGQKGCVGRCHLEPTVEIFQAGEKPFKYENVDVKKARQIVLNHLVKNSAKHRKCRGKGYVSSTNILTGKSDYIFGDIDYFMKQKRMALRNCGVIDPESLDDYLSVRGYEALAKVLSAYTPEKVIDEIIKSGLRGRGGGGFPTGTKWTFVAKQPSDIKYVICNADEGDPGAFMDRSVIEGDPFSVLEAMTIGGFAVGASQGIVYIRAEYPLAVERLKKAIIDCKKKNLLGKNILGSNFSFDIDIVLGAGAFVCGEETALINSIMGMRGMPRIRPPFPAVKGLWGRPTLINNVETWANIPVIILDGSDYFASIGTEKSKGTKVFALAGKIKNTGLVEVPMGTSLGEVVFDIGGGTKNGIKYKAAQTGGPSGGCLPTKFLNTPIDYDSLISAGSIMGSGGLIVMDEKDCMVDVAKFFLEFTQDESCGKCTPCREGTKRMLEILERITKGEGKEGDIEKLEKLGNTIKKTALCGLGQTAPNPVLSTIKYFREEYESHIRDRKCKAAVCGELFVSPCQHTCPVNIDIPGFIGNIREGKIKESIELVLERNPLPSVCGRVCHHPCESNCRRGKIEEPVAIMMLKRFAADYTAADKNIKVKSYKGKTLKESVAVIGSGPAGLSCAYHLAKRGYQVTIYEAEKVAGGMLRIGIPEYRLPKNTVERDINRIKAAGVKIKTGVAFGKDISLKELKTKGFKAVFLAIGAWKEIPLKIKGTELPGFMGSLSFLKSYNTGKIKKINGACSIILDKNHTALVTGQRVAVVGGGNAAMDVARTCLRLGASEVNIVYRRDRAAMPAIPEEVFECEKEGVKFHFLLIPNAIKGKGGKITELECLQTKAGDFDASGRRRPVATEEKFNLPVDIVISAIGGKPSGAELLKDDLALTERGTLSADSRVFTTNIKGVFAGGDVVTGGGTVIESVADGEKAAISIDRYLKGEDMFKDRYVIKGERKTVEYIDPSKDIKEKCRIKHEQLSMEKRLQAFMEVDLGYEKSQALEEADRCLRCDKKEAE
ncbi:MAG: FAD-dependent oxidoreductase [Candidatus Firestonebacteria bacterium]